MSDAGLTGRLDKVGPPLLPPDAPRFVMRNLSVLAYSQGFTLWHYRAPEGHGVNAVEGRGYFDGCAAIAQGDLLFASCADGFSALFAARVFDSPTRGATAIDCATISVNFAALMNGWSGE